MNRIQRTLATIAVMLAVIISGCSSDRGAGEKQNSDRSTTTQGEHDRDGDEDGREGRGEHGREGRGEHGGEGRGEHGGEGDARRGEEGEESGTELALNESYDEVRNGARLILAYDAQSNSFNGTVENTTDKTLKRVRVEVHLSNGKELGPTTPADLAPGEKRDVKLKATNKDFNGWTAHPEVGIGEHGSGEGRGEHDREGRGEHK